jgi:peptidoglycan/LPS O-acetylase OafA/YrhL
VEPFRLGHRPALDGLRGLAIIMVLLAHIPKLPLIGGFVGVDLFFVLSGFLITSLLLEEWRETGDLSLKAFYARRALRLLPALATMLLAAILLSACLEAAAPAAAMRRSALITLLYSANWFLAFDAYPRRELSPTWSLSVEEQFYVLWPILLLALLRMNWSRTRILAVVGAGILASAVARWALWEKTGSFARVYFGTDTHSDGLLLGSMAALLVAWGALPRSAAAIRALNWFSHGVVLYLCAYLYFGWPGDPYLLKGSYLLMNAGMAALIVCLVLSPWPGLRMLFEFAPLVWVGRVSYGLYLWHMVTYGLLGELHWVKGEWYWEAALTLTVLLTAASFYGLERPILRLKRRFERVRSS